LTHSIFWKYHKDILANTIECEQKVKHYVSHSDELEQGCDNGNNYSFIKPTQLAIGNYASGKPPHCWQEFDIVINCSVTEYKENRQHKGYLHLPIPDGKKGQIVFGASIQKAIDFVYQPILENKKVLVHCSTGINKARECTDFFWLIFVYRKRSFCRYFALYFDSLL
jgi:tRNA A64-2'-O-ribosylphosphate transferase